MEGGRLFFEIAAGLIPLLVFGGLLSERLLPPKSLSAKWKPWAALGVLFAFGVCPVLAEILAIDAAISGEPTRFETWVVATVVVFATLAIATALVWPWLRLVGPRGTPGMAIGAFLFALIAAVSVPLLSSAVDASAREECIESANRKLNETLPVLQYAATVQKSASKEERDLWITAISDHVTDVEACIS